MVHYLNKLESPSPKGALCHVWLKMTQWFWRKKISISSMYFRYFVIISPWKRVCPSFEQSWTPITQVCFVPSLVEIGNVVLEKIIFKISSLYIFYFVIISLWGGGSFIWENFNPHYQRMHFAKIGCNWHSCSGEDFLISIFPIS